MQEGKFTKVDINDAKKSMLLSLNYSKENINAILSNYEATILNGTLLFDKKLKILS